MPSPPPSALATLLFAMASYPNIGPPRIRRHPQVDLGSSNSTSSASTQILDHRTQLDVEPLSKHLARAVLLTPPADSA